jgi:dTDP-4-amino-4,6-dideoxygalactose transaminase
VSVASWRAAARAPAAAGGGAWRHQLPVYSPLSLRALLDGLRATARRALAPSAAEPVITLLRQRYAPRAVLLTESGTAALTAALVGVLQDRPGAAAALPAFCCYDVATAALGADVPALLYDTDPHSLTPDLDSLRATLRQGVGAIVVAHLFGYPVDLGEVNRLAADAGAVVIEDAAQAAGATLEGRVAGAQSSLAVLSFGRGKGLTGGGGGALLAYDAAGERVIARVGELLRAARRGWPELAALTGQWLLVHWNLYGVAAALPWLRLGETIYREPRPLRVATPVSRAVVAATWRLADQEVPARRGHAEQLLRALQRQPGFETIGTPRHARPGYLRLPVLAAPTARRAVASAAARRLGVMPSYPQPLCDLGPLAPRCANRAAAFPGGRLLAARLCTLPTHSRLDARDLTRLEHWIRAVGGS